MVTPTSGAYYYLGGYLILNFMHEIGHALGLSHPDTYDVSGGQPLSFANNVTFSENFRQHSIKSDFGDYKAAVGWTTADDFHSQVGTDSYAQTPMRDDVPAIQSLYGANLNTRSGDTRYGFNVDPSLKKTIYDFTYNKAPLLTIWDGGGNDTLDLSGSSATQTIDPRPGAYSSVLGLVDNVAIACNCTIENAVAGSGSNTIIGNDADNVLTAGAGVDRLEGGAGNDTFRFTAAQLSNSDTVLGGTGFDQLGMTTAGIVNAPHVSGVETYVLASGGTNTLSLANANFTGITGGLIRVFGGDSGNNDIEGRRKGFLFEILNGIDTIKTLALGPRSMLRWRRYTDEAATKTLSLDHIAARARSVVMSLERGMSVGIGALGALFVLSDPVTSSSKHCRGSGTASPMASSKP